MRLSRLLPLASLALLLTACGGAAAGWTFAPAPSTTPVPSGEPSASVEPSGSVGASVEPSASASDVPAAVALDLSAFGVKFEQTALTAPAGAAFQIAFDNKDAGIPHNVAIHEGSETGPEIWKGEIVTGPAKVTYDVTPLTAGTYAFVCTVHPTTMFGTLTVQ